MEVKSTNQGPLPTTNSNPLTSVKPIDRKLEEDGNVKIEKLSEEYYEISSSQVEESKSDFKVSALVAGAWTERKKMYHGGSFLKLADDNMDIQNPEAQNRELSGF